MRSQNPRPPAHHHPENDEPTQPELKADEEEASPAEPTTEAAALLDGSEYRVGDCFVHQAGNAEPSSSPDALVRCHEPHDGQIFVIDDQFEAPPTLPGDGFTGFLTFEGALEQVDDSHDVGLQLADYVGVVPAEVDDWLMDAGLTIRMVAEFTGGTTGVNLMYLASIAEGDQPLTRSYRAS
jgi:hypothetical protein